MNTFKTKLLKYLDEWVDERYPESEVLIPNGFEEAFIGVANQFNTYIPIFDRTKCIDILIADGMSHEEAEEFFEFNVQGAWCGNNTPAFLEKFEMPVLDKDEEI